MKVKIGNNIFDGVKEPIMVIFTTKDKKLIRKMPAGIKKYCQYPETKKWMKNNYENIRNWMKTDDDE